MIIRPFTPSDLPAVIEIFRSNIPMYFSPDEETGLRNFFVDRSDDYFIMESDAEIIGSGGFAMNNDDTVSLCWGMIRSDHIGKGLGRILTEFRIAKCREKFGKRPLVISTSQHTEGFYEKFGFRLSEKVPNGFGPGIDMCNMRLECE